MLLFQRYFKKILFSTKIWHFDPLVGLYKSFSKHHTYISWRALLLPTFIQKIKTFWRLVPKIFFKRFTFGPNLTFWPPWQVVMSFFQKSKNVTFLHLWCCNFVQKIRKIWRADPEISALLTNGRTNGRTDGSEFIGPNASQKFVTFWKMVKNNFLP